MASFCAAELNLLSPTSSPHRTPRATPFLTEIAPKALSFLFSSRRAPPAGLIWKRDGRSSVVLAAGNRHLMGSVMNAKGLRFAVVVARFNEIITNPLLEGALQTFKQYSVKEEDIMVVEVPGSFEIPVVAQKLGKSGAYHAVLCIGAVVEFPII